MRLPYFFVFAIALYCNVAASQSNILNHKTNYKVIFYNVENMFDTLYDSSVQINSYYSGGEINWNTRKYVKKRNDIYKTLTAGVGLDELLLVGLAEVENKLVLTDMLNNTPLARRKLKVCHYDSHDKRGIDVALIYNPAHIKKISCRAVPVTDSNDMEFKTRDILYFKGLVNKNVLHVFVVHFTSRYSGVMESEQKRILCSETLLHSIDTIFQKYAEPDIIVMGDFNDEYHNLSFDIFKNKMNDLMFKPSGVPLYNNADGSRKYKSTWYLFDHFFVSRSLINHSSHFKTDSIFTIFDPPFLLEEDEKYLGFKPFRSNIGYRYNGGISDHLPISLNLSIIAQ